MNDELMNPSIKLGEYTIYLINTPEYGYRTHVHVHLS